MAGYKLVGALLLAVSSLASALGATVTLEWDRSPSPNVAGYYVYRSVGSAGDFRRITPDLVRETRFTDLDLEAGRTYFYVCTAVGTNGLESAYSNQVSYTAPAEPPPPPPPPVGGEPAVELRAVSDAAETPEDTPVTISVLANDQWDAQGGLRVFVAEPPRHGAATVRGDGSIRYQPEQDYSGEDRFRYSLEDGWGRRSEATVQLQITPVNDPPAPQDDWAVTGVGTPVEVNVLENDRDAEGDALRLVSVGEPGRGKLTFQVSGVVRYEPPAGFAGSEAVRYVVSDGSLSAAARLTIEVQSFSGDPQLSVVPVGLDTEDPLFSDTFVGAAAVNPVPQTAALLIEAYAGDGTASLHSTTVLPPRGQVSQLVSELSDVSEETSYLGFSDPSSRVANFFLVGDFSLERLDGLGGRRARARRLVIPQVLSAADVTTVVQLVNPGAETAGVELALHVPAVRGPVRWRGQLPPRGSVRGTLREIFGGGGQIRGFLEITATTPVEAFAVTASPEWFSVVGGQEPQALRSRYAAHVAAGPGLDTLIHWVNVDHRDVELLLVLLDDRGRTVAQSEFTVQPGDRAEISIADLLAEHGIGEFSGAALVYSESNPPALGAASLSFTTPAGRSSLPLTAASFSKAVLPHVAVAPEPAVTTGLALFNPNLSPARVRLRLFAGSGALQREIELRLGGRRRLAGLLDDPGLFGPGWSQLGGYLVVESDLPLAGVAGFSTGAGASLSLVELQRLEE
ncbi:MAG: hypothetical protein Kow00109_27090 [Acidobacteriota bacterium]